MAHQRVKTMGDSVYLMTTDKPFRCPRWLDDYGRREWQRLLPKVRAANPDLRAVDALALAILADALGLYFRCRDTIQTEGLTIPLTTEAGTCLRIAHPLTEVMRDAGIRATELLHDFALTPEGRREIYGDDDVLPPREG
jgi:P27 family predicted phage terminase small subunit